MLTGTWKFLFLVWAAHVPKWVYFPIPSFVSCAQNSFWSILLTLKKYPWWFIFLFYLTSLSLRDTIIRIWLYATGKVDKWATTKENHVTTSNLFRIMFIWLAQSGGAKSSQPICCDLNGRATWVSLRTLSAITLFGSLILTAISYLP